MRIGVFDSGLGGLTVLHALRERLPGHDYVYLGDTARIPYGTRAPRTVVRYALTVASHLVDEGVEALIIACNTATAHALEPLQQAGSSLGLPVLGVIEPGVQAALSANPDGGPVAVLGTAGTIGGGAYQAALAARAPHLAQHAVPCPLFVPLVEEGWLSGPVPTQVAESYVGHLRGQAAVAILGCTHYPLLKGVLAEVLPGTTLVDSAQATAAAALARFGPGEGAGSVRYLVTDSEESFRAVGAHFLGETPDPVTWVDLAPAKPPFVVDEEAGGHSG